MTNYHAVTIGTIGTIGRKRTVRARILCEDTPYKRTAGSSVEHDLGCAKGTMETDNVLRTLPAWRITLLGGLTVEANGLIVDRFEHRKAASLLAYLAYHPHRKHSREELMEMLWPEEDPEVTRVRFRQALLNLRRALDGAGAPSEEILHADRTFVWLDGTTTSTDIAEFEYALSRALEMDSAGARADSLLYSVGLVKGELLPGYYDSWIGIERLRLMETHMSALSRTAAALADVGKVGGAIEE